MSDFIFVTSNSIKLAVAKNACDKFGISFDHSSFDFVEIQAKDGEPIARDKAEQASKAFGKPVVITDDSWLIPALNGFPGPYMRQVNDWLTPKDFLNLTRDLEDRRIILRQIVVYQDKDGQRVFSSDIPAILLTESRGKSEIMHFSMISFDGGEHSASELFSDGKSSIANLPTSWDDLCKWLQKR